MKIYFIYQTPRKLVHITSASQAESNGSSKPIGMLTDMTLLFHM